MKSYETKKQPVIPSRGHRSVSRPKYLVAAVNRRGLAKILLSALFLMLTLVPGVQSPALANGGDVVWQATDAQPGKQEAVASVMDSSGNVIITGNQNLTGGTDDNMFTVKFRGDGSGVAWRALFDKAGGEDRALAVAVDGDDNVIVAGYVWNGINRDIQTIKYNGATGAVVWQHTFNGAASGGDIGAAVAVDSLNNIYVGANSQNAAGNDDMLILKYAPSGPQGGIPLWQAVFNGTANGIDQVNAVAAGTSGIAVTGRSWNGTAYDMLTLTYDAAGTKQWEKRYSTGPGVGNGCIGNQVKVTAAGEVVAIGSAANGSNLDIYTVKYGAAGAVTWQKTFDGGFDEEPLGLFIDAGGDVYITGYTYTLTGANDFFSARYAAATGATVWQQMYDSGSGNTDMAVATGIVVDPAGDVFVTGYTVTDGNYDFRTIKYRRENGNLLWQQSYNAPASKNDRPVGIGISPSGNVIVAGWTDTMANDLDLISLSYDKGLLNPATGLTAAALSTTSIQLAWSDNAATEDGFKIERRLGETGVWAQIATVPANGVSFTDTGLQPNNAYYYRVRAYSTALGDALNSNEAHALTVFVNFTAPAWSFSYNNPDNTDDYANAIAVGPDNNPVVTGYSNRTVGTFDYFTLKLNRADKSVLWSDLYDDADSEMDEAKCLAVDGSNNAIVSGISQLFYPPAERNINSIYTIKYPASGPPESWHGQYNGPGAIDDRATAIATTTDGANNVVIIGYGKNGNNNDDIYVVKYPASPTLNEQGGALPAWYATPFDRGGNDIPSAVVIAPDGSVYVTGISEKTPGSNVYNWVTAKYDGTSGALVWSDVYSVTPAGTNRGNSVAVDANGDVYVTGSATTASLTQDVYTIKYSGSSSTASRIWERAIDGAASGDDAGTAVRVDPIDGAIVVAGTVLTATPGDNDTTLVRYTSGGDVVWQRTLLRHDSDDITTAMTMDSSGYIYLAGNSGSGAGSDIISLIYDFEGNLLGATSFDGPANDVDEASSITANYKGEAFIAGYTGNAAGNADYVVLKQVNDFILVPAPVAASAPSDSSRLNLSWVANTAGTTFLLERTTGPVNGLSNWQQIATPAAGITTYQDSGLAANSSYCYRVTALSGSFSSRKLITCATTTPAAPTLNPLNRVSSTAIDVSWSSVAGNSGYRVERSTDGSSWAPTGGDLPAGSTVYHDTSLSDVLVYYYRVTALSSSGPSLASAVQVAPVLNAPAGITSAKIDLSWPAVAGASGYKLERSLDTVAWAQVAAPSGLSYSDITVASGVTYYYRLTAVTAVGDSVPSLVRTAKTKLKTPTLSTPVPASTTQIGVSWTDPNNNETGYTLEYAACSYDNPNSCSNPNAGAWGGWIAASHPADAITATVSSLVSGRTYRFRITGTLSGADSDPSAMVVGTTNLTAPTNLSATAATLSTVTLTWSDVLGDTGYKVEQNGVLLGVTLNQNSTSHTVSGLSPNIQYCFRVQPNNSFNSAFSNQACVTIYDAPTLTSAVPSASSNSVTVSWPDVPGSTGFDVWRSTAASQSNPPTSPTTGSWGAYVNLTTTPLAAGTLTYTSTGLSYGYTYKYKIRYKLPDGAFSPYSNEILAVTLPPVPTGSYSSVISTTQINYFWNDGFGEKNYSYQIKQRAGANCTTEDWTGVSATTVAANATGYSATGLAAGATYCFRLNASNDAGTTAWSSSITQTTLLPPPTLNALTGVTQSAITLSWNTVTGNNGYRIDRSTDGVSFSQVATPAVNATSYTDSTLLPNQIYYYRVSTKNSAGTFSVVSNVQSATTLPVVAPVLNQPSSVTVSQMTLTWSDVPGNAGYKVERSPDNTTWTQVATPGTGATSFVQTGLQAGTLYYFRIFTRNSAGGFSAPSNVRSATTTPAAPGPATLAVISESRIDLTWQVVAGGTNYRIIRSIGSGGPWTEVGNLTVPYSALYCGLYTTASIGCPTLIPSYTTASDTGLAQDTQYCYQLTAWNSTGGDSAASPVACLKTPAVGGPVLSSVTAINSLKVRVDWSYNPAACVPVACGTPEGFEVWRQLYNGEWALMGTAAATTYLDSIAIEPSSGYRYKVRAYKGGDRSPFSNVLQAVTPAYGTSDSTCPE